jgi:hypothetical protein
MAKLSFFVADGFFSIMLFSSCFKNSFIIQEFFQLIELRRKGNQFSSRLIFSERKRAKKLQSPMDK